MISAAAVVADQPKDQAEVKSRKDAVFLVQIRSGHCLSFKA